MEKNYVTSEIQRFFFVFFFVLGEIISIFHGHMVWIEKSVTRVTDWHHEGLLSDAEQ